jgi:hypothetical protein
VDRSGGSLEDPSLIGNREDIPENQDPAPDVVAYNTSFGTSFRGELLSVECLVIDKNGGVHSFSVLWRSPKFITEQTSETGGDAPKEMPLLTEKAVIVPEGRASSSCQKSTGIAETAGDKSLDIFDSEGLPFVFYFRFVSFRVNLL